MEYTETAKQLLEELLAPIPFFVRPMAKKMIDKKIREVAAGQGHTQIEEDDVIRGYILAGEQKDQKRIKDFLVKKGIDLTPYQDLFK
ncbi:DUF2621 family protein [Effusibacillus pohliae]|uniref:DUF2621 family protein n=1 Tax=Effusibacillus pohliae TaxID=232270 RepID=UPI0003821FE3|nr:DUF2621 family protein [Effusibacillus pohliae]